MDEESLINSSTSDHVIRCEASEQALKKPLHLRSSQHADGGSSVEAVAAHQVGDVVLDLHLLPGEAGSLKQLSSGRIVVLKQ